MYLSLQSSEDKWLHNLFGLIDLVFVVTAGFINFLQKRKIKYKT